MRNPDDLTVVALAEEFAVATYHATKNFPKAEQFGLVSQMRRAAISVGSNIVEGCSTPTERAFVAFLHRGLGSVGEVYFQARVAGRLGFGDGVELVELRNAGDRLGRAINSLIRTVSARAQKRPAP
jgi:four helix bundle protein